jgi:hypothetical protein
MFTKYDASEMYYIYLTFEVNTKGNACILSAEESTYLELWFELTHLKRRTMAVPNTSISLQATVIQRN